MISVFNSALLNALGSSISFAFANNDFVGRGYDLVMSDLWTWKGIYGSKIFDNFSENCIVEYDCPHVLVTINENFTETHSWYQYFSKSVGLNTDLSWNGLDLSVSHSMGQEDAYLWWTERSSTYIETTNIRSCQMISENDDCNPYKLLSTDMISSLTSLPLLSDDAQTMDLWRSALWPPKLPMEPQLKFHRQ